MNPGGDVGPELAARLSYLLKRALVTLDLLHAELLAPYGIDARELTVLMLLADREPESQQQIVTRLGVDRTTMVAFLDRLETAQLVVRQTDPTDRRRNVIVLTEAGRETLAKARRASDQAERRLLDRWPEEDADRLRQLLGRINPADADSPVPGPPSAGA